MIIIPLFLTNFKYTNFNMDKLTFRQKGSIIFVDAYYLQSVSYCPVCKSNNLYRDGFKIKTVKHCTNYT